MRLPTCIGVSSVSKCRNEASMLLSWSIFLAPLNFKRYLSPELICHCVECGSRRRARSALIGLSKLRLGCRRLPFLLVVEILFRDLADRGLRQCIADLERLHHFVLAELVLQEYLKLVERERRCTVLELDEGFRRLAAIFVADSDHRHLLDGRVLVDRLLENARIDVVAAAQQHVLGAVDDENEAVLIHVANIASAQETIERRHIGRRLRVVPVTFHDIWALDADFAALAEWDVLLRVINAEELDDD